MKKSLSSIIKHGQFGMPGSHIEAVLEIAESLNLVIAIKKVSAAALSFIESGFPTKSGKLKTKTTHHESVLAGLIPLDPVYSDSQENEYQQYQAQLKTDFKNDPDLLALPCMLSEKRINELKELFPKAITLTKEADQYLVSWKKQKTMITVKAKKNESGEYGIYDANNKAILVVGKEIADAQGKKSVKPLTSDYDLLVICPSFEELDLWGKDMSPPTNLTERNALVLNKINKEIAKRDLNRQGINLEVVHHGDEFHNPHAGDMKHNLPSLFLFPGKFQDQPNIALVENEDELQKACEAIISNNYYLSPHPKHPDLGAKDQGRFLIRGYLIIQAALLLGQQIMGDGWVGIATLHLFM